MWHLLAIEGSQQGCRPLLTKGCMMVAEGCSQELAKGLPVGSRWLPVVAPSGRWLQWLAEGCKGCWGLQRV
jgi:hypothetical protein